MKGILALLGAFLAAGPDAADLEVAFGEGGLSRLSWRGADLLKEGRPQVRRVVFERETPDEKGIVSYSFDRAGTDNPAVGFDRAGRKLSYGYPWGSVSFAYAPGPDRLGITVTIANRSRLTLADFEIALLAVRFPSAPSKPQHGRWIETPPDRLPVVEAAWEGQKLLLCGEAFVPYHLGLAGGGRPESEVVLRGGVPMMEPGGVSYPLLGLPRVPAGQELAIPLSLRFASSEACRLWPVEPPNRKMLSDLYAAFRRHHQPVLNWKDRRPIGTVFVGRGKGPPNNARNWFDRKDLDVRTPEGRAELRRHFLELAERCLSSLKKTNAQGVIVWDPEGSEHPHPVTYIGDPRMVKILAPEVEDLYPDFFRKFIDAGLRTGCCIRPTQVYFDSTTGTTRRSGSCTTRPASPAARGNPGPPSWGRQGGWRFRLAVRGSTAPRPAGNTPAGGGGSIAAGPAEGLLDLPPFPSPSARRSSTAPLKSPCMARHRDPIRRRSSQSGRSGIPFAQSAAAPANIPFRKCAPARSA